MKKAKFFLFIFIFICFSATIVYAQESESDIQKKIEEYQNKLTEIRTEKNTLSSQIEYMDTQIYLAQLKIQETEQKITQTQKEIETLGSRIEGLDSSLNYLSKLLLEKVVQGYKQRSLSLLDYLLDTSNAAEFLSKVKYLKTTQNKNQNLVVQVQQAKLNFEEQKTLREQKVIELDDLKNLLNVQKQNLDNQKVAKQKLLAETQNSETVYQNLLAQAQRQLAAFKSFVQTSGANSIVGANGLGTGSDGVYFSQRDERWANQLIGSSSENILNVGCLISSVAMVLKKNGVDTNPSSIASNTNYFDLNTANMKYRWSLNPWPNGLNSYKISTSQVDEELNNGHYVIVGINYGGCSSTSDHFVVITKKDGDEYIMHDPVYGPDLKFSSHYSAICWAEVFK